MECSQRDWLHVDVLQESWQSRAWQHRVYNIGGIDVRENQRWRGVFLTMGKPETLLTFVKDRPGHDRRYALDCSREVKRFQTN